MSKRVRLTCVQRDEILGSPISEEWCVESGVTDAYGKFGEPRIETTWCRGTERVKDVRHPALGQYSPTPERPDVRPCEHFYWIEEAINE
jgi:hypothetical protein